MNISIATGFIRPKTTALFFDKLYIPSIDYFPESLSENYDLNAYRQIPRQYLLQSDFDVDVHTILPLILLNNVFHYPFLTEDSLTHTNILFDQLSKDERDGHLMNYDITTVVRELLKTGLHVTPIYNNFSEFAPLIYENNELNKIIQICINYIPEITEEKLEWKQISDIRQDKKEINNIRRFRNWALEVFSEKSMNVVQEKLELLLYEYKNSLKKHGILTALGGISTALTAAASLIDLIMQGGNILSTSFSITAGLATFSASELVKFNDIKKEPIALIYDVLKKE